jgi:hypothetical protein
MFSDLGSLKLLASLDKLINEIGKNRNASSEIMSFRLTSCYDFSFVGCKNHLTCIPRACNDQDYVSISVPARFYWLQKSGTEKCPFFFLAKQWRRRILGADVTLSLWYLEMKTEERMENIMSKPSHLTSVCVMRELWNARLNASICCSKNNSYLL